jgi:Protein of unknown function (DUF2514)
MRVAAILLGLLSALLGYAWQSERAAHASTTAHAAKKMKQLADQAQKHEAQARKVEKELSDATIEHSTKVAVLLAETRRAALRGAAGFERLHNDARTIASGAKCVNPETAADIQAGPSVAGVLADLFRRADERAGELAQIADESRIRGIACEADYDRAKLKD